MLSYAHPNKKDLIHLPLLARETQERYSKLKKINMRYSKLNLKLTSPDGSLTPAGKSNDFSGRSTKPLTQKATFTSNFSYQNEDQSCRLAQKYVDAMEELSSARLEGRKANIKGIGIQDTPYFKFLHEEKQKSDVKRMDFIKNLDIEKRFLDTTRKKNSQREN